MRGVAEHSYNVTLVITMAEPLVHLEGPQGSPLEVPQGPPDPGPGLRADPGGVKNYPPRGTVGI